MAMVVRDFIEEATGAPSLVRLTQAFERATSLLGYEHFALAHMRRTGSHAGWAQPTPPTVALNYPAEWVAHYTAAGYFSDDPVVRHAWLTAIPYEWKDLSAGSSGSEILEEARDVGLAGGISIPIHEPLGRVFLATLATSEPRPLHATERACVQVLATVFHARYSVLSIGQEGQASARLTPRERECLTWVARGKSSWGISRLAGLSEHTVNFHLKNAMRKLGTATRVEAAITAFGLGLVDLA